MDPALQSAVQDAVNEWSEQAGVDAALSFEE
jgi:hypothetical protein